MPNNGNKKPEDVAEWERVHNATTFTKWQGKEVEFDIFLKLCLASREPAREFNTLKEKAHAICELGVKAGYLIAAGRAS